MDEERAAQLRLGNYPFQQDLVAPVAGHDAAKQIVMLGDSDRETDSNLTPPDVAPAPGASTKHSRTRAPVLEDT